MLGGAGSFRALMPNSIMAEVYEEQWVVAAGRIIALSFG